MKRLAKSERRYVAKPYGKNWRVYDRAMGSYPGLRAGRNFPTFGAESDAIELADEVEREYRRDFGPAK